MPARSHRPIPTMSPPRCRVCGSADVSVRGTKPGEFIRRDFMFQQCAACGFMFVEPFSGYDIYNDAYYRGQGPDPYVDYETEYRDWRRADRMLEFDDLARIAKAHVAAAAVRSEEGSGSKEEGLPRTVVATGCGGAVTFESAPPPPRSPHAAPVDTAGGMPLRWLDFGCGAGGLLKYLREAGRLGGRPLELTGHDVGSYAELLRHTDGFRILDLDELAREPADRFDVISMIEVIEHLADPSAAMALVGRLLAPGGLLLLTTGNLESPVARSRGIGYRYCAPEIHVSLFNPRCLAHLYRNHGLRPQAVRYRGAVKFKVVKTLRHKRAWQALARAALCFPPAVWFLDWLYGVSAMPCAVKPPGVGRT